MRTLGFAVLTVISVAAPATAQSRPDTAPELVRFIQSSVFADFRHWDWPGTPYALGGSVALGRFLNPRASFEIECDLPQFAEYRSVYVGPGGPAGSGAPLMGEHRVQSNRVVTVAALFGLHPMDRGPLTLNVLAGLAINHSEKRFRVENWLVSAPDDVAVRTVSTSGTQLAVAAGIDARVMVGRRLALVPQVRAFQGYSTGLILRPAVGVRVWF